MIVTINRFEQTTAVLTTDDGHEIKFPIAKLPNDCAAGMKLKLTISKELDSEKEKEGLAKKILNEILRIEKNPNDGNK